jgi:hypothetical protein
MKVIIFIEVFITTLIMAAIRPIIINISAAWSTASFYSRNKLHIWDTQEAFLKAMEEHPEEFAEFLNTLKEAKE